MTYGKNQAALHPPADPTMSQSLAARVLDVLAARPGRAQSKIDHDLLSQFCSEIRGNGVDAQDAALALLRSENLSSEAIADDYIPAAARLLGDEWCVDNTSFADVTIGTSRLQAMLRDLNETLQRPVLNSASMVSALVVVPRDEYHTLGAMALVGRLRRAGLSVRVCIGQSDSMVVDVAETVDFDLVLMSVPHSEKLESIGPLVISLKSALGPRVPIVVGGACLGVVSEAELKDRTGADHATNNLDEALRLCGLTVSPPGAGRRTVTT